MTWTEISLDTTQEAVDWISTLLSTVDYDEEIRIAPYDGDRSSATDPTHAVADWSFTVYLYFSEPLQPEIETIVTLLLPLHRTGLATDLRIAEVSKKQPATLSHPSICCIGHRFIVLPPNADDLISQSRDIPLILPDSQSFGSGLHPTTIVSLKLLERHVAPDMQVLDLGCGTGILSVAMAKLGAYVLALDNDRAAVQATQTAIALNQVSRSVTAMEGSLGQGSNLGHWMGGKLTDQVTAVQPVAAFDLIISNILPWVHITLASDFHQALQPAGKHRLLLTAGYTTDYESEVTAALTQVGFQPVDREQQNEWVAIAYRLPFADKTAN